LFRPARVRSVDGRGTWRRRRGTCMLGKLYFAPVAPLLAMSCTWNGRGAEHVRGRTEKHQSVPWSFHNTVLASVHLRSGHGSGMAHSFAAVRRRRGREAGAGIVFIFRVSRIAAHHSPFSILARRSCVFRSGQGRIRRRARPFDCEGTVADVSGKRRRM